MKKYLAILFIFLLVGCASTSYKDFENTKGLNLNGELQAGDSLPDQTGHTGEFLRTDGTDADWAAVAGGGDLLAANNLSDLANDTTALNNLFAAGYTWGAVALDLSAATVTFGLEDSDIPTALTLETISGSPVITNGVAIGTDDTDHLIDEASNGAGSATLYIGNESILASGDIDVSVQAYDIDLDTIATPTAWRVFYSDGSQNITELALGANGTYLRSNGATAAPTFDTPAGSGDVLSVGDCLDGACLDGTSDGGSYIRVYDGDSNYGEFQVPDIAANVTYTFPAVTDTILGVEDINTIAELNAIITDANLAEAPTNATIVDSGDENATFYLMIVDGLTGSQAIETDAGLPTYNPSTNTLDMTGTNVSMGLITLGNGATSAGYLDFLEDSDNGTDKGSLIGPAALAAGVTWTLPSVTGTLLTSNANTIDSDQYVDGSIDEVHRANITRSKFIPVGWMQRTDGGSDPPESIYSTDTNSREMVIATFDGATDEDLSFVWSVPPNLTGSDIKFQWMGIVTNATGPSSEAISFQLSCISVADGEQIDFAAYGTAVATTESSLTEDQDDLITSAYSAAVTPTGLAAGEVMHCLLNRDADGADTYAQDFGLIGIRLKWQEDPGTETY